MAHVHPAFTTEELLAQCVLLLNDFGPGSPEVDSFIDTHESNREFVTLARLSSELKRALTTNDAGALAKIQSLSSSLAQSLEDDPQEGSRVRTNEGARTGRQTSLTCPAQP